MSAWTETESLAAPDSLRIAMYVTINGKEWGLYLGVEAIEETFLDTNFADGTGDLYYPDGTGSDLKWISDDIDDYTGINLKTNDNSDQSAMIKMLDVINNGGNLEEVLNVDEMLRYFAANTALVNLDHYQGDKSIITIYMKRTASFLSCHGTIICHLVVIQGAGAERAKPQTTKRLKNLVKRLQMRTMRSAESKRYSNG